MKGKRKTQDPCPGCQLHRSRCLCAEIPELHLKTRLSLVIHYKELRKSTNSGQLAVKAVRQSQLIVRGLKGEVLDLKSLVLPGFENLLFFPGPEAEDLEMLKPDRPVHLIVPDGTWRQARKVASRHPELAALKRVQISVPNLARHHLRKEHLQFGMSTLEAVAQAIQILESEAAARPLFQLYRLKLERTLAGRGILS